ncbi:MAG: NAD(P)H-dependent oxidoreductase subunit E [Candidatus Marinimicrobia bacterium]|nr:NAD(P)H-dependent oxidoreductase subunit E [Candidatus Neomarinimicrobiota bacterium]
MAQNRTFKFTNPQRVEKILSQYPDKRSATLPLLHLAQEQEGYLTSAAIEAVAELVEIHPGEMMDTVSFYTMFYTKPMGKNHVQVCQTLSCSLNGADSLVDHISEKYKIAHGDVSQDGKISLVKVECLGSCDTAPVIRINDSNYESMTVEKFDKIVESI